MKRKSLKEEFADVIPAPQWLVERNKRLSGSGPVSPEKTTEQARRHRILNAARPKSPCDIAAERLRRERTEKVEQYRKEYVEADKYLKRAKQSE